MENKLITWLDKELNDRGWSQRQLAKKAKLSNTTVSDVLGGQRNITFDFCAAIAGPLGKQPEELFRLAGLLPAKPAPPPVELPEPPPVPDDEHIMELFKLLDSYRRRVVYDFTRWQLKEQLDPANSSGRRRDRAADEDTIGLIDFMTAVERATPEEREQFSAYLIARLHQMGSSASE